MPIAFFLLCCCHQSTANISPVIIVGVLCASGVGKTIWGKRRPAAAAVNATSSSAAFLFTAEAAPPAPSL